MRRLDVVNRGYSGYNTSQARVVLPQVLPPPALERVRLMVCPQSTVPDKTCPLAVPCHLSILYSNRSLYALDHLVRCQRRLHGRLYPACSARPVQS